jgi:hypothetical protein
MFAEDLRDRFSAAANGTATVPKIALQSKPISKIVDHCCHAHACRGMLHFMDEYGFVPFVPFLGCVRFDSFPLGSFFHV